MRLHVRSSGAGRKDRERPEDKRTGLGLREILDRGTVGPGGRAGMGGGSDKGGTHGRRQVVNDI